MGDTAVETECLGDIDREKIVATIENERTRLDHTDVTSQDLEQQELHFRLVAEHEEAHDGDPTGEAVEGNTVQIKEDRAFTSGLQLDCKPVEQVDFAPVGSTSPEISAADAKESSDSNEGADLVTILVLEKTEEEKSKELPNREDQIVIETSVADSNNSMVSSSIDDENQDTLGDTNSSVDQNVDSSVDRNGIPESGFPNVLNPIAEEISCGAADIINSENTPPTATTEPVASTERFLILNNNSPPEGASPSGDVAPTENTAESLPIDEKAVKEEAIVPNQLDEKRFKEIEILVAAFDGLEENSSNQSSNEPAAATAASATPPDAEQPSPMAQESEVPSTAPGRRTTSRVTAEPKSEKKPPKAKRTGGPPTRRESANTSDKAEIPNVVGNGKLRVHGYEKLNEQTGLPELVLVNREILERIISDQERTISQTKSKLKEMCKICDDLRKVVLVKGLNTVLSPEEANLPVDVVIKMQKLPPHVPTFQTVKVARTANGNYDLHAEGRFYNRVLPVKKWLGVAHAPKPATPLALGANRKITSESKCKVEFNIKVLPKDIVRALTNGDVLTVQQRQRFIDKITYDIIKAKGVPQPQQIQEIAMQVANMYPRSLVILPEGKRKSSLRKRGRADDDDEDSVKSSVPKRAKKESLSKPAAESPAGPSPNPKIPVATVSDAIATPTAVARRGRGRPPKTRSAGNTPESTRASTKTVQAAAAATTTAVAPAESGVVATAVVNGSPSSAPKRKVGRPRKPAQAEPNPRHVEEEQALSLEEQKKWLQEDVNKPFDQQDAAKQHRLLHNCYDKLYEEMAANNYDCAATISEWPVLRKAEHVLSVFKRLKNVHGRFQEAMRKDAPKLVTFLHERVNTEEGAEWSLRISQAKLSDRYQLPEEVGVMPLLALNFEEDFSLLFKLVADKGAFEDAIKHVEPVPIIIGVGESIFNCEYHVVVERQLLYSPKTYLDALELVYAAYFVFNLAYPKALLNTFEYVQRHYVGYNPPIKTVTLTHTRPKIALFLKKLKDFERLDWNSNIRANSPGVPSEFERESDPEADDMEANEDLPPTKPGEAALATKQHEQQTPTEGTNSKRESDAPETEEQPMETEEHSEEKSSASAPVEPEAAVPVMAATVIE